MPFEDGKVIDFELDIPGNPEPLKLQGKVAHQHTQEDYEKTGATPGAGIQFVELTAEAKSRIHQYLTRVEVHRRTAEHRRGEEEVPQFGSLTDFLVPEVLHAHVLRRSTGRLLLQRNGIEKSIYFADGRPLCVESSILRGETLGAYLLRAHLLTPEKYEQVLSDLGKGDSPLGELLVSKGLLTGPQLAEALVAHQEEKIMNSFSWFEGSFEFAVGTNWLDGISPVPLRPFRILFEGTARSYDPPLIKAWTGVTTSLYFGPCGIFPPTWRFLPSQPASLGASRNRLR